MEQRDTRWLQTIMDYQGRTPSTVSADASIADDLNTASGTIAEVSSITRDEHTLSVTKHDEGEHQESCIEDL